MSGGGRYRKIRRIGRGGMAETFECVHELPSGVRERVCLKRILPAYRNDPEIRRLFHEEGRLSSELLHPNVVRTLAQFEDEEGPGIVFELVDGVNLRELIDERKKRGGALPIDAVVHWLRQATLALDHAHRRRSATLSRGLVHRDITPSNLLVDPHGELKIADFGIARPLDCTRREEHLVRGKLPYLAPEVRSGAGDDERSDLYALGVVAYELITLRRPPLIQPQGGEGAVRSRPSETIERSDVPDVLRQLIDALLARDPDDRPPNARAVIDELESLPRLRPKTREWLAVLVARCLDERSSEEPLEKTEHLGQEITVRLDSRAS